MIYSEMSDQFAENFVHKRTLRGIGGFISGGPSGAIRGFLHNGGPARPVRLPKPRTMTARPTMASAAEKEMGRAVKFGNGSAPPLPGRVHRPAAMGPQPVGARFAGLPPIGGIGDIIEEGCIWPMRRDPRTGECRFFAGDQVGAEAGAAVMGQYGAALEPGRMPISRRVCIRGMQLGSDGLCYNKGAISNKQRMWPKGRAPLLTGGDMRAISIANRASDKLERTTKRLQKIGMMRKPSSRRRAPKQAVSLPAQTHSHLLAP
jgi:hypothetical protein